MPSKNEYILCVGSWPTCPRPPFRCDRLQRAELTMCQCSSRLSQKRRLASSVRNAARQALFFLRFSLFKSPGLCCHRIDRDRCCRMPSDDDLSRSPPHEESHWMPVSVRSEIISSVLAEQSCSLNMSQPYLGQTPMLRRGRGRQAAAKMQVARGHRNRSSHLAL